MPNYESWSIKPDLPTLARYLSPGSEEAERPELIEKLILKDQIGLNLPADFIMTDFDELILSYVNQGYSQRNLSRLVNQEFQKRGIETFTEKYLIQNYLEVLRGKRPWQDQSKPAVSANFPIIRTRYNAMRMLESGVFPDHKRYIQYIAASVLASGLSAEETGYAMSFSSGSPSLVVDMMMLDLYETSPDELNSLVKDAIEEYKEKYPKTTQSFDRVFDAFESGQVLVPMPRTRSSELDSVLNHDISNLWLETLRQNPTTFRSEDMEYVLGSLEVFVRGTGKSKTLGRDMIKPVNQWIQKTYGGTGRLGQAILQIALGADFDNDDVTNMVDRGLEYLQK